MVAFELFCVGALVQKTDSLVRVARALRISLPGFTIAVRAGNYLIQARLEHLKPNVTVTSIDGPGMAVFDCLGGMCMILAEYQPGIHLSGIVFCNGNPALSLQNSATVVLTEVSFIKNAQSVAMFGDAHVNFIWCSFVSSPAIIQSTGTLFMELLLIPSSKWSGDT